MKILHTLLETGSTAPAAAVLYPGKVTRMFLQGTILKNTYIYIYIMGDQNVPARDDEVLIYIKDLWVF